MIFKTLKKDNNGMTLVELLIAVAIFVAAIVPMLYAFVYSTGYNFKSQQTMQSTGIAEAIIEKCKGAGVDADDIEYGLINPDSFDAVTLQEGILYGTNFDTSAVSTAITGTDEYWLYDVRAAAVSAGEEVDAGNMDRRSYDVRVKFFEAPSAKIDVSTIQSMTSDTTANFEGLSFTEQLSIADDSAYGFVFDNIKNYVIPNATASCMVALPGSYDPASNYTDSDINPKRILLDRKITITAEDTKVGVKVEYYASYDPSEDGTGTYDVFKLPDKTDTVNIGGTNYAVTIECEGQLCDVSSGAPGDYTYNSGSPIYTAYFDGTTGSSPNQYIGSQLFNASVNPSAVFFYYYPGYLASYIGNDSPSYNDHFVIVNKLTAPGLDHDNQPENGLSVYLFKQYDSTLYNHGLAEEHYVPTITMSSANGVNTYLFHNLLFDSENGNYLGSSGFAGTGTVTEGANCFNMTKNEGTLTSYSAGLRDANFHSLNLSDKTVLPYLHHDDGSNGSGYIVPMFDSRYVVEVRVFPAGKDTIDSDEIEIMQAEVLNW